MSDFGARLRAARKSRKWTQGELSKRTGLSLPHIGRIERGVTSPGINTVERLAKALGIKAHELMGSNPGPESHHEAMRMEFIMARAHETAIMALNTATLASKLHVQAVQAVGCIIENDFLQYLPADVQHALLELVTIKGDDHV